MTLPCLAWCQWRAGYLTGARRILDSLLWLEPSDAQDATRWIQLIDEEVDHESPEFPELVFEWWSVPQPAPHWDEDHTFPERWT